MMQKMREWSKVFLWILVLAFIGWIGLELGADITSRRVFKPWERGVIAKVGNFEVSYDYFNMFFQRKLNDTIRKLGRELTPDEIEIVKDQVFNELVSNLRWSMLAQKLGISLHPDALVRIIAMFPPPELLEDTLFFTDGKFDFNKYVSLLRTPEAIPFFKMYEARIKTEIPRDIIRFFVLSSAMISDKEAYYDYLMNSTQFRILFLHIPTRVVSDTLVSIHEDSLRRFYEEHKEQFRQKERIRLEVYRLPKYPSQIDTLTAKDKAQTILEQIREGVSFEEAVMFFSEDPVSKQDSGRIGRIFLGTIPEVFRNALKDAKSGDIVGPILYGDGYYIVKVDSVIGDTLNVRQILVRIRVSDETRSNLKDSLRNLIEEGRYEGLIVDTTPYINVDTRFLPYVGSNTEALKFVRKADVGKLSEVFETPNEFVAFRVVERKPSGIPKFEEIKPTVEARYIHYKKKQFIKQHIPTIKDLMLSMDTLKLRSIFPGALFGRSGLIRKGISLPQIPFTELNRLYGIMFRTPLDSVAVLEYETGILVFRKLEEHKPTFEEFQKIKHMYKLQMFNNLSGSLLEAFQRELEEMFPLEDYRAYMNF